MLVLRVKRPMRVSFNSQNIFSVPTKNFLKKATTTIAPQLLLAAPRM